MAFYSFAEQALMRMPVGGGASRKISDADTPTGINWGPNGMVLFGQGRRGIWLASVNAQSARKVAEVGVGEEAHGPWLLPDNDHFLYTIAKGRGQRSLGQRADCRQVDLCRGRQGTPAHRQ